MVENQGYDQSRLKIPITLLFRLRIRSVTKPVNFHYKE